MKYLIWLIFIVSTSVMIVENTFAMRCNGKLVYEGDSAYELHKKCKEPDGVQTDVWGDQQQWFYETDNGSTNTVTILNGRITEIDEERNQ